MIFKEVETDGKKKYFMGNTKETIKEVSEEVYNKLIEDDDMFRPPKPQKLPKPEGNVHLLSKDDTFEVFQEVVTEEKYQSYVEGMIDAYREIGDIVYRIAAEIEAEWERCEEEDI